VIFLTIFLKILYKKLDFVAVESNHF